MHLSRSKEDIKSVSWGHSPPRHRAYAQSQRKAEREDDEEEEESDKEEEREDDGNMAPVIPARRYRLRWVKGCTEGW